MGRSNVGKSSALNRLLGRPGLARVSKAPGRTRAIHFYLVDERAWIVDLPGYGYARVSREMRRSWQALVDAYLDRPGQPRLAIHLVDIRHDPTPLDRQLAEALRVRGIPTLVVLTKADKVSGSASSRARARTARILGLEADAGPLVTSARTGAGFAALARAVDAALAAPGPARSGAGS
ncbi:MAG: hypothetical protein Kow0062_09700 [Acidobacteriota bacterium]